MELAYTLSGSAPLMKRYQIGVTSNRVGVPYTIPASNTAGVVIATTTGATDMVGCNVDTSGTYVTAIQSDGTDPLRQCTFIINPDAVWKMLMTQGATNNTSLSLRTVTTANTDGLSVTTAEDWSSPTYDEGYTWGYDGACAKQARKITSVSSTAGTVTVAFRTVNAVGDNFIRCPYTPQQGTTIQLTTNLDQADASIAVGTGAPFRPIELIMNDLANDGRNASYVLAVSNSHSLRLA